MSEYYVAQYPKDRDEGKQIGSQLSFADAKKLADETPEGYEREVYNDVDGKRRVLIYLGKFERPN